MREQTEQHQKQVRRTRITQLKGIIKHCAYIALRFEEQSRLVQMRVTLDKVAKYKAELAKLMEEETRC